MAFTHTQKKNDHQTLIITPYWRETSFNFDAWTVKEKKKSSGQSGVRRRTSIRPNQKFHGYESCVPVHLLRTYVYNTVCRGSIKIQPSG